MSKRILSGVVLNTVRTAAIGGMLVAMMMGVTTASAAQAVAPAKDRTRVVLVGASIGKGWDLPGLTQRLNQDRYVFEALQAWQFDKSEAVDELLMRPARKFRLTRSYLTGFFKESPQPADVVILKECSAYFPSDLEANKTMLDSWVKQVRARNIPVMLATVVPVTKERSSKAPGKLEGIRAFNDWIRQYAGENRIVLIDLEKAMRTDARERYLRDEFTSGDGSHLNRKAYDILDGVMAQALCALEKTGVCSALAARSN